MVYRAGDVELVEKRVAVLGYRGGEHDDFVNLANPFEEGVNTGALDDIDIMVLAFDFDRDSKVSLVEDLSSDVSVGSERGDVKTNVP